MLDYAKSFIGTPYKWGGNNPLEGLDCSGFVLEVLRAFGYIGDADMTAQDIYNTFKTSGLNEIRPGSLLFFGKSKESITHIAIALDNRLMIEAGGGGPKVKTIKDAAKHGAFIRIRPIQHRRDLVYSIFL